jgi:putative lipoic acid-binding regulatory protein
MVWLRWFQLLACCSPVLSLLPALPRAASRVAADGRPGAAMRTLATDGRPALRTPSRRYAADDDEKIINIEDLPELGACGEPKKHKDPASKDGEALTDRFLMAARALRGEFDPEETDDDTEENSQLLGAIIENYPAPFSFTAVGRSGGNDEGVRLLVDALTKVVSDSCEGAFVDVVATPRIGGKFASVRLTTDVQSPEMINRVFAELRAVEAVKMAF